MKRWIRGVMVGALAVAFAGLGVTSAQAANTPTRCGLGSACLYFDLVFSGSELERWANHGTLTGDFAFMNNQATSLVANGASCAATNFFDEMSIDTSKPYLRYNSMSLRGGNFANGDLRSGGGYSAYAAQNWNDRISAHQFTDCG